MWARAARLLRRVALLTPLLLTVLALLLLPRPPSFSPPARLPSAPPQPKEEALHIQNSIAEDETPLNKLNEDVEEEPKRPWFMSGGEQRPWHHDPNAKLFPEDAPGDDRLVFKCWDANPHQKSGTPQGGQTYRRFAESRWIQRAQNRELWKSMQEIFIQLWTDVHRIVEQLTYTLPKDEDIPIKKILLANGLGSWGVSGGRTEFIRNKCPVDRCSLTADARDAATADAILYKDHHTPFNVKRPHNQIWILYYLECPYHTASLRPTSLDVFNWTATYRRDSDIVAPYERWVYHDELFTEKEPERNYAGNKTKKVAWFVSNCHARNRRLQYARQLAKFISVDIYGACGSHHCPRADPNCLEMLDKEYKFYLAFENSNCRDYVTEKFFVNGLQHDVLPIVMGARPEEYAAVAPHNSYIHVEEFAGPEELAAYLRRLDEDDALYNSYFKWKGTGEFINTYFFCRVCAMVHANARRQRNAHYTDVQAWWRDSACTRTEWRAASREARSPRDPP